MNAKGRGVRTIGFDKRHALCSMLYAILTHNRGVTHNMFRFTILLAGVFAILLTFQPVLFARTLEKKEEADPVLKLKQEHQVEREKATQEIRSLETKINGFEEEMRKLDSQLNRIKSSDELTCRILDQMHELVIEKEGVQKELSGIQKELNDKKESLEKENLKQKEEVEALKASLKKDLRKQRSSELKQDLRKYEKIVTSPSVEDLNVALVAWKALAAKYPKEAAGVETGDLEELQFRIKYGGFTNTMGMRFVLVQAGSFRMGSPDTESYRRKDELRHKVTLKNAFYLQTTEVTQDQWIRVMGENPSFFKRCGRDCPVENVSWDDCREFIEKLNQLENTKKYRLPTEAEWEYACRAGRSSAFANGDIIESGCGLEPSLNEMGWYCANSWRMTHSVAKKISNRWGLYDMHGNVWEWCQDWYGPYAEAYVSDPEGSKYGPKRAIRGGSCLNYAELCRSASRFSYKTHEKMNNIGLRVARTK